MNGAVEAVEEHLADYFSRGDLAQTATGLLRGYGPQVHGYLLAVLRDDAAATDVFSQFSEDLWAGLGQFRRESTFRTWAFKLAWHAALRFLRDPYRRRGRRLMTEEISRIVDEVCSASVPQRRRDGIARLRESLAPDEQTILVLRLDRELSWSEVAQVMSEQGQAVDEAALRKRFERIKDKLRKLAEEQGLID